MTESWEAVYVGSGDWDLKGPKTREHWVLASAAPDLLEALLSVMETYQRNHGKPHNLTRMGRSLTKSNRAIAKAIRKPE